MKDKWILVEERLPEPGKYILLSFSNFSIPVVGRWEECVKDGNIQEFVEPKECRACSLKWLQREVE